MLLLFLGLVFLIPGTGLLPRVILENQPAISNMPLLFRVLFHETLQSQSLKRLKPNLKFKALLPRPRILNSVISQSVQP